ncbi:MAG: SCP2 sterol-binding domain-containing protein [Rhizobiaceae bacterium]|nr:SCP2 sterol-binding domain-containing protein [Rhizobiaceae bacterium]
MTLQEIADKISAKAAGSDFSRSVKFDLGSDGIIVIDGGKVSTTDADVDCTIKLSKDNLEDMMAGELNPTMAYMSGKLKIEGDLTVAMQLSQVI